MLLFSSWDCYFYDFTFCHLIPASSMMYRFFFKDFHHRSSWEQRIITDNVGNGECRCVYNFASSPGLSRREDIWLFGTSSSTKTRKHGNTSTENIFDGYFLATCKVSTLYSNTAEIVILWVGSFFHYFHIPKTSDINCIWKHFTCRLTDAFFFKPASLHSFYIK